MNKLFLVLLAPFLSACGPLSSIYLFDKGQCVWVSHFDFNGKRILEPVIAEFIKYENRVHWFIYDGHIVAAHAPLMTQCEKY